MVKCLLFYHFKHSDEEFDKEEINKVASGIKNSKVLLFLLEFILIRSKNSLVNFNEKYSFEPLLACEMEKWNAFVKSFGLLKNLSKVVKEWETFILTRKVSGEVLMRLTSVLGPDFLTVSRLYLLCTGAGTVQSGVHFLTAKTIKMHSFDPLIHSKMIRDFDVAFRVTLPF